METKKFDILIIGSGVAGMTAGVYAKRRGKNVAIIESGMIGGTLGTIAHIENFPSYPSTSGAELLDGFLEQLKHLEIPIISDKLESVEFGDIKVLHGKKATYTAPSVIIATGLVSVRLGANEEEFLGRGVSYCATCDAHFFKGQNVCVISKGGSGIRPAMHLCDICKNVYLIDSENLDKFAQASPKKNLTILSKTTATKFCGKDVLESVEVSHGGKKNVSGAFIELGKRPNTALFSGVKLDEDGFIITDEHMQTSVSGVFACGDIRAGALKQLVTACADGAIAGQFA